MKNYLYGSSVHLFVALALCSLGTSKVVAQVERSDYVPFVEEGKAWYCGYYHPHDVFPSTVEDPNMEGIDCIFTMHGDTLICDREYKKVYCQFGEYYGDEEQHYYCAVREETYQVFIIEEEATEAEEKLLYDFSNPMELVTLTINGYKFARLEGWRQYGFPPGQMRYKVCKYTGDEVDYFNDWGSWVDGVGCPGANPFAFEFSAILFDEPKLGKDIAVRSCMKDGKYVLYPDWLAMPMVPNDKCATPTIAYDKGKLVFSCETPDAECVYEIKCSDNDSGRGGEVSLSQTYEIRVHATLDGYEDSDVATATIGWRNSRPVMEGFSSVTLDTDEHRGDVNGDGIVDVADIATVISVIAAQKSE